MKSPFSFVGSYVLALVVGLSSPSWSQAGPPCSGPIPQRHPYGNFVFETNSRIENVRSVQYRFGAVACVSNMDNINPLYVHWFIPGPKGWVPASSKLESTPRLARDDKNFSQLEGCLEYGNRGDTSRACFFGALPSDQKATEEERARGCRATAVGINQAPDTKLEDIFFRIRNFFPSDAKNPKSTMLELGGDVYIKSVEANHYLSYFDYTLTRYAGSAEGTPASIILRPDFRGPAENFLLTAFRTKNPDRIPMSEKGTIFFEVVGVLRPQLIYGSYQFYDRNDQIVGAINFPLFVPASAN